MRYAVKWSKDAMMQYISHLDMMRLFQRALKRAKIPLMYSQGYSPHPKMSIAQPLSLGYTSKGEYLEIETAKDIEPFLLQQSLQQALPKGIGIESCRVLERTKKALGALVDYAAYEIRFPMALPSQWEQVCRAAAAFQKAERVMVQRLQKKSATIQMVDIKPLTEKLSVKEQGQCLEALICTGSRKNLSPQLLLEGLSGFAQEGKWPGEVRICRKELYTTLSDGKLLALWRLS